VFHDCVLRIPAISPDRLRHPASQPTHESDLLHPIPDHDPRIDESCRRHDGGFVTLWVVVSMGAFLGMVTLSFSLAQGYLVQDQLQISADAASRAAMITIRRGGSPLEARARASFIARGTRAIEGSVVLESDDVVFGDFNPLDSAFTPGGTTYAAAVRVSARRTKSSPAGPVRLLFQGLFDEENMNVAALSTASTGCREVVFVVDGSTGMEQEIDEVYRIVSRFIDAMELGDLAGDKIGMVVYAARALSAQDYSDNNGQYWFGGRPDEVTPIPQETVDLRTWISALISEGKNCEDNVRDRMPTLGRGSCLGKGDHHGINKAVEMFDEIPVSCSADNERVIVLITSDTPCWELGWRVGDPVHLYGGSLSQAYQAADDAHAVGINIQPILVDRGRVGHCPLGGFYAAQRYHTPTEFIDNMARGFFTDGMVNPSQNEVDALLTRLDDEITVRIVD
jgi:hypothetical protein